MAKLLGPRSGTAWAGRTGEHKHRAFPSRRQSLRAATGSLEENVLPLLRYRLSSRVKKVLMQIFFHWKWNFHLNRLEVVADQSRAHCFAQSCDHSLVSEQKYGIGTKPHVLNRILCKAADLSRRPVQEKSICSDSNQTAQLFQMVMRKSFETMSGVILNQ